jgi:hypothetical protein
MISYDGRTRRLHSDVRQPHAIREARAAKLPSRAYPRLATHACSEAREEKRQGQVQERSHVNAHKCLLKV